VYSEDTEASIDFAFLYKFQPEEASGKAGHYLLKPAGFSSKYGPDQF
jgi:hypothetical protein